MKGNTAHRQVGRGGSPRSGFLLSRAVVLNSLWETTVFHLQNLEYRWLVQTGIVSVVELYNISVETLSFYSSEMTARSALKSASLFKTTASGSHNGIVRSYARTVVHIILLIS